MQSFTAEQEKLHDNYEKKKQEIGEKVDELHKALEKFETDNSITVRQDACKQLVNSVNAHLKRAPLISEEK